MRDPAPVASSADLYRTNGLDRFRRHALWLGASLLVCASGACLPKSDEPFQRQTEDDAGGPEPVDLDAGVVDDRRDLPPVAAHAVLSVTPNHGPFNGGQSVLVRGNGFASDVSAWFGPTRVDPADVVAVDPSRVQVKVPPGTPGAVRVAIQNGSDSSTRAELDNAYIYDPFYVEPASGPASGGTEITLHGSSTAWDADTEVLIDLVPCEKVLVLSQTELTCVTPKGTRGSKTVRVVTLDGNESDVLDAFVYGESETRFRGGLAGEPLEAELTVTVLDDYTGSPIPGASVIVGSALESALVDTTDNDGLARFDGQLGPAQTVTVAAKCFSPVSFVDVPVDNVVAYLDPVLDVSCASFSDIPALPGGGSSSGSTLQGELIWPGRAEFDKAGWTNVPLPKSSDERLVAYVFRATSSPSAEFRLPSSSAAVTPTASGDVGYTFYLGSAPGNATYYALAGLENRSLDPPLFTAYAMGVAEGVTTQPDAVTSEVFIPVDVPLDHALAVRVVPPQTTSRGPDRIRASAVLRLSEAGYAPLPVSHQTQVLPGTSEFDFIGLPALSDSLAGSEYVTFAEAVSGDPPHTPDSFGGLFATSVSSDPVLLDQFVEVPTLEQPANGSRWNGVELEVRWAPGGVPVDLIVFEIEGGGGLMRWTIAAPGHRQQIQVPDLRSLSAELALPRGALSVRVTLAQIADFVYGTLRYRQLRAQGQNAFARDVFKASY